MSEPMRTLLVGLGARGKIWSRLLNDEPTTETVGFVDVNPDMLPGCRTTYGATAEQCFTDLTEALRAIQPELVLLATPPMDRYAQAIATFESGAHLLSENR